MTRKHPYKVVMDDNEVGYVVRRLPFDIKSALRERLPTLEDALGIEPLERDPWRFVVTLEHDEDKWDVVIIADAEQQVVRVLGVWLQPRKFEPVDREEAMEYVRANAGKNRTGIAGSEYVDELWRGFKGFSKGG